MGRRGAYRRIGDAMTKAPDPVGRRTRRAEDAIALSTSPRRF
jgi:hypothetical protein